MITLWEVVFSLFLIIQPVKCTECRGGRRRNCGNSDIQSWFLGYNHRLLQNLEYGAGRSGEKITSEVWYICNFQMRGSQKVQLCRLAKLELLFKACCFWSTHVLTLQETFIVLWLIFVVHCNYATIKVPLFVPESINLYLKIQVGFLNKTCIQANKHYNNYVTYILLNGLLQDTIFCAFRDNTLFIGSPKSGLAFITHFHGAKQTHKKHRYMLIFDSSKIIVAVVS